MAYVDSPELDEIRRVIPNASSDEARALVDWCIALRRNLNVFPAEDLRQVEPPLRSTPGPRA